MNRCNCPRCARRARGTGVDRFFGLVLIVAGLVMAIPTFGASLVVVFLGAMYCFGTAD